MVDALGLILVGSSVLMWWWLWRMQLRVSFPLLGYLLGFSLSTLLLAGGLLYGVQIYVLRGYLSMYALNLPLLVTLWTMVMCDRAAVPESILVAAIAVWASAVPPSRIGWHKWQLLEYVLIAWSTPTW